MSATVTTDQSGFGGGKSASTPTYHTCSSSERNARPASGFFLSNPFKPSAKGSIPISHLDCWRPRRDLNPCYRGERASWPFWTCLLVVAGIEFCPVFSRVQASSRFVVVCTELLRFIRVFVTQALPEKRLVSGNVSALPRNPHSCPEFLP